MPRIVCRSCGRGIYTTAPIEMLFADERRCPRCGANLSADRRESDRRTTNRRQDAVSDPPEGVDNRVEQRRRTRRRRGDGGSFQQ